MTTRSYYRMSATTCHKPGEYQALGKEARNSERGLRHVQPAGAVLVQSHSEGYQKSVQRNSNRYKENQTVKKQGHYKLQGKISIKRKLLAGSAVTNSRIDLTKVLVQIHI